MKSKRDELRARLLAARQLGEVKAREFGFESLPVDPFEIAKAADIVVQAKDDCAEGVSGMLLRHGDNFGILYSRGSGNDGFERFSVAHELGHYFIPGHAAQVLPDNGSVHSSRGVLSSQGIYELEADYFAAGLLMPTALLKKKLGLYRDGLRAVEGLSELCKTSLLATAISYIQTTACPSAMVVSSGRVIEYAFLSESLRYAKGIEWPRSGDPLSQDSLTIDFNADDSKVSKSHRGRGKIDLSDWFGGASVEGYEEMIGLGTYGKTLTIITCLDYPSDDEIEEDNALERSLVPTFRR